MAMLSKASIAGLHYKVCSTDAVKTERFLKTFKLNLGYWRLKGLTAPNEIRVLDDVNIIEISILSHNDFVERFAKGLLGRSSKESLPCAFP